MKICYLGDAPSGHLRKFVDYFSKRGNEIHIISLRPAKYNNAVVHPMPRISGFDDLDYLLNIFWVKKRLRIIKPDILHAHYLTSYGLLGALSGFHPLIVTAWGTDLLVTPKKLFIYGTLLRYTLKKADLITDVAPFMNQELLKFGADPERILTSPMGIDTGVFQQGQRKFKKNLTSVLSMRALIKNSNVETIINAMQILKKNNQDVKLIIANTGRLEKKLRMSVKDLELNDVIQFTGVIEHSQTVKYFTSSDIYISVTSSDGASVALLEAMACGAFPIVSDIPANREWIKNGENGFLVPLNDSRTLAEKITLAAGDQGLREKAAHLNWQIINQEAKLEKNMVPIEQEYKSLIKEKTSDLSLPSFK